jgi:hypothetical protein
MVWNTFLILWLAGACAVLGLAIYRKLVARREDDLLHIGEFDAPQVAQQAVVSSRLDVVDKWGVALTIAVVAFGILLAGIFLYAQWQLSLQIAK